MAHPRYSRSRNSPVYLVWIKWQKSFSQQNLSRHKRGLYKTTLRNSTIATVTILKLYTCAVYCIYVVLVFESSSKKHEEKISWFSSTANVNRKTPDCWFPACLAFFLLQVYFYENFYLVHVNVLVISCNCKQNRGL